MRVLKISPERWRKRGRVDRRHPTSSHTVSSKQRTPHPMKWHPTSWHTVSSQQTNHTRSNDTQPHHTPQHHTQHDSLLCLTVHFIQRITSQSAVDRRYSNVFVAMDVMGVWWLVQSPVFREFPAARVGLVHLGVPEKWWRLSKPSA